MEIQTSLITVDLRSRKLIYEQLIDNIKELIIDGTVKRDDSLPSVRALARENGINPNTIQKAYSELEKQKIIVSHKGRGSFIALDREDMLKDNISNLRHEIRRFAEKAHKLGLSRKEFETLMTEEFLSAITANEKEEGGL